MKARSFALVAPALALGLACKTSGGASAGGQAAAEPGEKGSAQAAQPRAGTSAGIMGYMAGRVTDVTDTSLTIQSDTGARQTLSVGEGTRLTIDGQTGRATDLQPGQDVRASYDSVDGRNVAVRVEATSSSGFPTGAPGPSEDEPGHPDETGSSPGVPGY
jgi:hypothetical protein